MTINGYKKVKEKFKDSCAGCDLMINGVCKKSNKLGIVEDCIGIIYKKEIKEKNESTDEDTKAKP